MKYLSKLIMAIMAVPAFTIAGCSGSDVSDPDGSRLPENAMVYINVDVQLPDDADTRANTRNSSTTDPDTSSDGEEGGTDAENAIHSALIILKGDGANIHAEVVKMASKDGGYTLTAVVPLKKALEFGNKMQNKPFNLYVVANPGYETITRPMLGYDVENYIATVSGLDSPYLTTVNGLPMSNFEEYTFTIDEAWTETFFADFLSDTSSLDLNRYNDNKSITLERSVARIDYRDKERNDDDPDGKNPHEYKIGESGYTVKIVGMCPVNVSKNFYTFRHIWVKPESGTPYLDFLGRETSANYFLDTDNDKKQGNGADVATNPDHFINQGNAENAYSAGWENLFKADNTNKYPYKEPTNAGGTDNYTPWRYLSENTIADATKQLRGYTTAIVFRAELTGVPDTDNETFKNHTDPLTLKFKGRELTVTPTTDADAQDGTEKGKYYLYYYHFIKHNDNNDPAKMEPMEFGVVRNNIYKLSIQSISGLPRPYNPEDPDEPTESEITITSKVKKWIYHRINIDL